MSWNYRIVRRTSPLGEPYFALHEVYYEDNDITKPNARSDNPDSFVCDGEDGPEGIIASLELALKSVREHPVLDDPWPDEILPHMIEKFPEDKTLKEELDLATVIPEVITLSAREYGFSTGFITLTSAIAGIEPRVKFSLGSTPDEESMSVSIDLLPKIMANSLPAFFRHAIGPKLCKWVASNRIELIWLWVETNPSSENIVDMIAHLEFLEDK